MERVKVAILGGSGYTAVELIKILLRHPGAEIAAVTSRQDEHIADLHPSLFGRLDLRCEPFDPDRLKAKGVRSRFHGLRVTGGSKLAKAVVTVLPRITAPACRSRSTQVASRRA